MGKIVAIESTEAAGAADPVQDALELVKNIVLNGPMMIAKIAGLVKAISGQNFFGIGQNAGGIVALILTSANTNKFIQGLIVAGEFVEKNFEVIEHKWVPAIKDGVEDVAHVVDEVGAPVVDGVEATTKAMYTWLFEPDQRGKIEAEAKKEEKEIGVKMKAVAKKAEKVVEAAYKDAKAAAEKYEKIFSEKVDEAEHDASRDIENGIHFADEEAKAAYHDAKKVAKKAVKDIEHVAHKVAHDVEHFASDVASWF